MAANEDDLSVERTQGYKGPGVQRTAEELASLDYRDQSLIDWERNLGLNAAAGGGTATGPNVTVLSLVISSPGPADIILDLSQGFDNLRKDIVIKEGVEFSVSLNFKVNHSIVSGLTYVQIVKKLGITVSKNQSMIGSFGPSPNVQTKKFASEDAPSGMMARSNYKVKSRVTDDDGQVHAEFEWTFNIKKDWQ